MTPLLFSLCLAADTASAAALGHLDHVGGLEIRYETPLDENWSLLAHGAGGYQWLELGVGGRLELFRTGPVALNAAVVVDSGMLAIQTSLREVEVTTTIPAPRRIVSRLTPAQPANETVTTKKLVPSLSGLFVGARLESQARWVLDERWSLLLSLGLGRAGVQWTANGPTPVALGVGLDPRIVLGGALRF